MSRVVKVLTQLRRDRRMLVRVHLGKELPDQGERGGLPDLQTGKFGAHPVHLTAHIDHVGAKLAHLCRQGLVPLRALLGGLAAKLVDGRGDDADQAQDGAGEDDGVSVDVDGAPPPLWLSST